MKKLFLLFIAFLTITTGIIGCSKSTNVLSNDDYELSNNITSKNITIGSSSEDFIEKYNGYYANVMYGNNNKSEKTEIKDIDYSDFCYVYLYTIFLDDKAMGIDDFINKNNINTGIDAWFSNNSEYLDNHSVILKSLVFAFQDSKVIGIQSLEKNYNK